jgi:hypothetical protein
MTFGFEQPTFAKFALKRRGFSRAALQTQIVSSRARTRQSTSTPGFGVRVGATESRDLLFCRPCGTVFVFCDRPGSHVPGYELPPFGLSSV